MRFAEVNNCPYLRNYFSDYISISSQGPQKFTFNVAEAPCTFLNIELETPLDDILIVGVSWGIEDAVRLAYEMG